MVRDWAEFLAPYGQAVEEMKVKLKGIRQEYRNQGKQAPIEFVTGRVKTPQSIMEKVRIRDIAPENFYNEMQDIGGLRIMCQFVEDIYTVVDHLKRRQDFQVILERDYVSHKKASGYRSYHVVVNYPVERVDGIKWVLIEIQIRTLAMNFWATIEHSLNYKYRGDYPEHLHRRLERAAEAAFSLDEEMSKIREEIHEAQHYFDSNRNPK
ncbi:GTP pyrophosphokinase [Aerococcus urinaehominis]|uniref:GTP pyrophosphokinase n=1 Tax=Aerococcus urinaehominis TaxID=128944 RepID=A0A120IB51_9LACT|nr:GTP pyrophosphokinase family protein [Aerococcus urinaehominis]AMC00061.1 GTP pyrophosphokinase [Aerococcus urinaehominis]SDL88156.1 putative GTP pyrophosphokinase [Aerococcus urinaehominis]